MGRLLVLVVLVVLAVWLLRRALRGARKTDLTKKDAPAGDLIACAHCGLNLPRAEALGFQERLYCSEEHARRGPNAPPPS